MTSDNHDADEHYYAVGYDVDSDPYVYENGVLINHFNIQNTAELNEIEAELSAIAILEISNRPTPVTFSVENYILLHKDIFDEVYPWAGEIRKVDICKGQTIFLENASIQNELDLIFNDLGSKNYCKDMDSHSFSEFIGVLLCKLNYIHPFREGNGRTQRLLISQLANQCNLTLNWASISNTAMTSACIAGLDDDFRPMQRLIFLNLESNQ